MLVIVKMDPRFREDDFAESFIMAIASCVYFIFHEEKSR